MGSFRRPRFMSSPVLSDLGRFQSLQPNNNSVWNSVQSAVIKVFQGMELQPNELHTLNQNIRLLLKSELGSFITEYFQNQLLSRALERLLERVQLYDGDEQLVVLSEVWLRFFTETLPMLQAIFYPVQGQELTVRQTVLLAFRDQVVLKLHLLDTLTTAACLPPPVTQMLLVLQGVHEPGGGSVEYSQLERLVEAVISPYLCNIPESGHKTFSETLLSSQRQPEIRVTTVTSDSALSPLVEQEGEAYLEKTGGIRRHTVANLLSAHTHTQPLG